MPLATFGQWSHYVDRDFLESRRRYFRDYHFLTGLDSHSLLQLAREAELD